MVAVHYQRVDAGVTVTLEVPRRTGGPHRVVVTGPQAEVWARPWRPGSSLPLGRLAGAFRPLPARPAPEWPFAEIERVVLDLPEAVAGLDWERALRPWAEDRAVVRAGPAPPTFAGRALALPLRAAQVALPGARTAPGRELQKFLDWVTEHARRSYTAAAVRVLSSSAGRLDANLRRHGWPTLDVVHVDGLLPATGLLDPDPDGPPGTLGWVERLAALYQLRLLVIPQALAAPARELAARIVARGGPAVVVAPPDPPGLEPWRAGVQQVYAGLVHDEPLDRAVQHSPGAQLFAGGGREEALRVSAGVEHVVTAAGTAGTQTIELADLISPNVLALVRQPVLYRLQSNVGALVERWATLDYTGEGRGLYPSAETMAPVVQVVERAAVQARRRGASERPERYVNALLVERDAFGAPGAEVPVVGPPLVAGQTYLLRVDVGPLAEHVKPSGALELLVEDQLWDPTDRGLWTELGVCGLGCTVLGDAVQPLWIPRDRPSEPRYVAIRMDGPGTAVLRYTVYCRTHVVQSFRLAAVVAARRRAGTTSAARKALAAALGLPEAEVGDRTWYARLEFSTVARVADARELRPRTVAIVANDVAGTPMLTVKSRGDFSMSAPADIDRDVRAARSVLNEVSGAEQDSYRFGYQGDPNATDDTFYAYVLGRLAEVGWSLCTRLLPKGDHTAIAALEAPDAIIQVAHVLRDKVVPWALVYDRRYDATARKVGGQAVEHVACSASLPAPDGSLPVTTCGTDPGCPLHPDRLAERAAAGQPTVVPATVACPLGFWGVRHQIELPPRQVPPGAPPLPAVATIDAGPSTRVMLAFNASIPSTAGHRPSLEGAVTAARRGGAPAHVVTDRDDIVDALSDPDLDVVYVFCHAQGGDPPAPWPPRLEFQEPTDVAPVPLTAADLPEVAWSHHPLVILNGCGTTGFSATATSEFIAALVDARQAAAVVGAEVPVAEVLAAEVGESVVSAVLDGQPLGAALSRARRVLLSRRNPLGLVYTLYGSAELGFR